MKPTTASQTSAVRSRWRARWSSTAPRRSSSSTSKTTVFWITAHATSATPYSARSRTAWMSLTSHRGRADRQPRRPPGRSRRGRADHRGHDRRMTLSRDARHIALPQVGAEGQQRIAAGRVLLIGAGGIGCAAAPYLASAGVGHLTIVDFDTIDETNLGRQVLYNLRRCRQTQGRGRCGASAGGGSNGTAAGSGFGDGGRGGGRRA